MSGQESSVMTRDDDTLLVGCRCCGFHFAQIYGDDPTTDSERFAYLTITAFPLTIRARLRGAWRAMFGHSWHESAEVVLDRNAAVNVAAALDRSTRTAASATDEERGR